MHHNQGEDSPRPVIEYKFNGEAREQICEFNLSAPNIGESVPILVDPASGEIFVVRFIDRWALSTIIVISIVFLVALSILSK